MPSNDLPPSPLFARFLRPAALLLALAGVSACGGPDQGEAPAADATGDTATEAPAPTPSGSAAEALDLAVMGYDEGDVAGAPVRVVEFSDFGCVYCARFHMEDYGALHAEFMEGGDVAWKYIPITIGGFPNGNLAAITAECVGEQGSFAPIRDLLFEERMTWLAATGTDAEQLFRSYAVSVGADMEAWDACAGDEAVVRRIERSNQVALELGVRATPTFIVQGFPVQGAPALADFQGALREMVAEVRAGATTPTPTPSDTPGG
jgi:protein-disulfide isomerase